MLVSLKHILHSILFKSLEAEPNMLNQYCIGYFLHKSCLLAMVQYCTGKFLGKCWSR